MYTYPNSVEEATKILDRNCPDWFRKVDVDALNMDDVCSCILGQVYGDYNNAIAALFGENPYDDSIYQDKIFGAKASEDVWKSVIDSRLHQAGLNSLPPIEEINKMNASVSKTNEEYHLSFLEAYALAKQGHTIENNYGQQYYWNSGTLYTKKDSSAAFITNFMIENKYKQVKIKKKFSSLKDRQEFIWVGNKYTALVPAYKQWNCINTKHDCVSKIGEDELVELI